MDIFGGIRYWKIDTTLEFEGGLGILSGQKVREAESWYDPLFGIKGSTPLSDSRFYLAGWFAVGGFDVGSDDFYDTSINIGYQWSDSIGTSLGYRVLDVKYDQNDFYYDVKQKGWALGLTWNF